MILISTRHPTSLALKEHAKPLFCKTAFDWFNLDLVLMTHNAFCHDYFLTLKFKKLYILQKCACEHISWRNNRIITWAEHLKLLWEAVACRYSGFLGMIDENLKICLNFIWHRYPEKACDMLLRNNQYLSNKPIIPFAVAGIIIQCVNVLR